MPNRAASVVLTAHSDYLRWVPEAVRSIDAQVPPVAEKVAAFDGCTPLELPAGWRTVSGDWSNPADARNAALALTTAPWCIFWDADNIMPAGYAAAVLRAIERAAPDVAILYPDLQHCDEAMRPTRLAQEPDWTYWAMRQANCVDTASAWRRVALDLSGGWKNRGEVEDFALALELTERGWRAERLSGPPVLMRDHAASRIAVASRQARLGTAMWHSLSLAVVTPFAGRRGSVRRWLRFFRENDLPDRTTAVIVDDSRSAVFRQRLLAGAGLLLQEGRVQNVDLISTETSRARSAKRHHHVAALYARALPRIAEDMILTLEDDIQPPRGGALILAAELMDPHGGPRGAVAGAYRNRELRTAACAGFGSATGWGDSPAMRTLPHGPIDVAYAAGGFTLWANWALRGAPVTIDTERQLGWDAMLCECLHRRGFRIRLHGGVRCRHFLGRSTRITKDYPWLTSGW